MGLPTGPSLLPDSADEQSPSESGSGKPAAAACVNGHSASAPLSSHTADGSDGSDGEVPTCSPATADWPDDKNASCLGA